MTDWAPPPGVAPTSQPSYPQFAAPKKIEPAAVVAFLLAVSGFLIPFVPALVALFLAPGAKRNIKASNDTRTGNGWATAAQILAAVSLLITIGIILLMMN